MEPENFRCLKIEESRKFERCLANPEARSRMQAFLAKGGQTRDVELRSPSAFVADAQD